jgi:hypothetical protein
VDGDGPGVSSCAIRLSIDSSFVGSTLSVVIKVRMSGSDNALLSVNSWLAIPMACPLVVSDISRQSRIVGEAFVFHSIECCLVRHVKRSVDPISLRQIWIGEKRGAESNEIID